MFAICPACVLLYPLYVGDAYMTTVEGTIGPALNGTLAVKRYVRLRYRSVPVPRGVLYCNVLHKISRCGRENAGEGCVVCVEVGSGRKVVCQALFGMWMTGIDCTPSAMKRLDRAELLRF